MARQLRVEFHGAFYYVLSRGNERNPIFSNDSDRDLFIKTLKESAEIAGVEVIAYVLMDNHYHMIIETPNSNLSHFMRHFGLTYNQSGLIKGMGEVATYFKADLRQF